MADIINRNTNKRFTRNDWRGFVEEAEKERTGLDPDNATVIEKGDAMYEAAKQIPKDARRALRATDYIPQKNDRIYLAADQELIPGKYLKTAQNGDVHIEEMYIDTVGKEHSMGEEAYANSYEIQQAAIWRQTKLEYMTGETVDKRDIRWAGPHISSFVTRSKWELAGTEIDLMNVTVKEITKITSRQMWKPPASETVWETYLGGTRIDWTQVWKLKSFFVSPRDEVPLLKIQHRNLFVAGSDPTAPDQSCSHQHCLQKENQLHLVRCTHISREYWTPYLDLLESMQLTFERSDEFLLFGLVDGKTAPKEVAGTLFLAWRVLYAETTRARIDGNDLRLQKAYKRLVDMIISRLRAYGKKWRKWSERLQHQDPSKNNMIPRQYRKRGVIEQEPYGDYYIHNKLIEEQLKLRQ